MTYNLIKSCQMDQEEKNNIITELVDPSSVRFIDASDQMSRDHLDVDFFHTLVYASGKVAVAKHFDNVLLKVCMLFEGKLVYRYVY